MREVEIRPKEMPQIATESRQGNRRLGALGRIGLAAVIAGGSMGGAYGVGVWLGETNRGKASDDSSNTVTTRIGTTDNSQNTPSPSLDIYVRAETDLENQIEERYGIEILDLREAYEYLNEPFDLNDKNEFGDDPPAEWPPRKIEFLGDLIARFPEKLVRPVEGESLKFALTDFGLNCSCEASHQSGLILLSNEDFKSRNSIESFKTLSHELSHWDDYKLGNSLWPKAMEILGYPTFEQAGEHFLPKIERAYQEDKIPFDIYFNFNYAFKGLDNSGLSDPSELIGELGETYSGGNSYFMQLRYIFGKNRATQFYDLAKNEIFYGWEYDSHGRPLRG